MSDTKTSPEIMKVDANQLYKQKEYDRAAELYTRAIRAASKDSTLLETLYSNRAACYLKTNDWRECVDDATSCLSLNPKNTKALWRRAQAMQEMHRLDAALSDLIQLLSCDNLKPKARDTYTKRARELKDHLEGVSTSSKDDPALTALKVLRDETHEDETKNVQLHKIGSAMEDHMWACRVVQRGGLETMWKLLENRMTCAESLACLAKIAAHSDLNAALRNLDWKLVAEDVAVRWTKDDVNDDKKKKNNERSAALSVLLASRVLTPTLTGETDKDENEQNDMGSGVASWAKKTNPDIWLPPRLRRVQEKMNGKKKGENKKDDAVPILKRRDLRKQLRPLDRTLLDIIVKGLGSECPDRVRESAVNACVRVGRDRLYAMYLAQPKNHGGGVMDLIDLADSKSKTLSKRVDLAMARIFSSLFGNKKEFEAPKKTAEAEPDPTLMKWGPLHHVIDRAVVPLLESTRIREQLRGLRATIAVWNVAPPVGLWMVNCDSMWRSPLSRLSYLAMSTDTRVQISATRLIANVASHPEGRDKISDLVVGTLERLLDSSSLHIQAPAALVVSRNRFKEWHPNTASGKRLLNTCIRLVNASGNENTEAREQGVEALSVLCLKYEAKHRILKEAVKSVCELSTTGNEDSSFWLGIANVLHELSTSEHEKNAELGRDMDITAEHFETLQRINNMKKDQDVAENLDVEARIHERIAEMIRCGACNALCRISSASSKRTKETVVRTMINFCKYHPSRGVLAAAGGIRVCSALAKSPHEKISHRAMTALARMLISVNPQMLREHQLMDAVVPLLEMSRQEQDPLMQFEASMALTNLSSFSMELKQHIVAYDGIVQFEMLQTHQNKMVRRASTEALSNLVPCEAIFDKFKQKDGKLLDWWMQLSEEESDFPTSRAACGMIAMISIDPEIANAMITRNHVPRVLKLLEDWDGEDEMAARVMAIMGNIIDCATPPGLGLKTFRGAGAVQVLKGVEVEDSDVQKSVSEILEILC